MDTSVRGDAATPVPLMERQPQERGEPLPVDLPWIFVEPRLDLPLVPEELRGAIADRYA